MWQQVSVRKVFGFMKDEVTGNVCYCEQGTVMICTGHLVL